ncbi:MAG: PA14 domain-containing protein [Candidatus Anammoxibacter sp.]
MPFATFERFDELINFNWGFLSPGMSISNDRFSVEWQGCLFAPEDGLYTFALESDDGSLLWIDETLIVNNWGDHAVEESKGEVLLEEGWHSINVRYNEKYREALIRLNWVKEGKKELVPSKYLCCKKNILFGKRMLPLEIKLPDYFF